MVLNDRPFGNALAVSFFRRGARLRLCAYDFHCIIQKRRGKLGRNVSFNEIHALYYEFYSYSVPFEVKVSNGAHLGIHLFLLVNYGILGIPNILGFSTFQDSNKKKTKITLSQSLFSF